MTKTRFTCLLILAAFVFPMAGCPGAGGIAGLWIFRTSNTSNTLGLELLPNGETANAPIGPNGVDANFLGSLTWTRTGDDVRLTQTNGSNVFYYTGKITNGSAMSGTFLIAEGTNPGSNFGYWSAVRVAQ
jgi:hypothetical protein